MRTLLLMRGAPGAGKSTFIRENHLEAYTLRADTFRALVANPALTVTGDWKTDPALDRQAWSLLFQTLEIRMRRGDFTIIDATHATPKLINQYRRLAEKFRYRVYIKTINPPLGQVLEQNSRRPKIEQVPDQAVKRIHTLVENTPIPRFVTPIDDVDSIMHYHQEDVSNYERVMVVGDVQGSYTPLHELLGDCLDPNTLYVFAGDLLDRGIENVEVFDWALAHCNDKNVIFVEGNHDTHIAGYGFDIWLKDPDGKSRMPAQFEKTVNQILETRNEETLRKQMRILARSLRQAYLFNWRGSKYFVCHGGLSTIPDKLTLVSTSTLIRGVGGYHTPIDQLYQSKEGVIQIHGHRHTESTNMSICLEDSVEFGGKLMVATISEQGIEVSGIENTNPAPQADKKDYLRNNDTSSDSVPDTQKQASRTLPDQTQARLPQQYHMEHYHVENPLGQSIIDSPYVKVRTQPHHAVSLNFTTQAFKKKIWDEQTIRARGLFLDQTTGLPVMRSYNKFFAVGERPETALDRLNYPLIAYRKENGFLGLIGVIDGETVLASKGMMTGPARDLISDLWQQLAPEQREAISQIAQEENCTLVFEVVHHLDRHIIEYPSDRLVLLDAVRNSFTVNPDCADACVDPEFSSRVRARVPLGGLLMSKQQETVFNSPAEVEEYVSQHSTDRDLEGLVLQDSEGRLTKLKLPYYLALKRLRTALTYAQKTWHRGISYGRFKDDETIKFISFITSHPYEQWKNIHILDAFAWYEREKGRLL